MNVLMFHPLAELFPLMNGLEFDELVASIRASGLRDPIVLHDGQILDGRNRYRACLAAGVTAATEDFTGDDPIRFVIDRNMHRRHLNESQRAMVAARLFAHLPAEPPAAPIENPALGKTRRDRTARAAALMNVSEASVYEAKTVLQRGTPEQVAAVMAGARRVSPIGRNLRGTRPVRPQKRRAVARSDADKALARIERMRARAEIFGNLRDALTHLGALPLASEVAAIARALDRKGIVDRRLDKSIKWLEEFAHAWRSRDENAA